MTNRKVSQKALIRIRQGLENQIFYHFGLDTNMLEKAQMMSDKDLEIWYKDIANIKNDVFYFQ